MERGCYSYKDVKPSAYDIAKSGGRHAGFYRNNKNLTPGMLERGIRAMQKTIEDHKSWIADPYLKIPQGTDPRRIDALVNKKWPSDIARIEEELSILQGILAEKKR